MSALASAVGDPDGTRAVGSIVALLIALGLSLIMVAIWLYRSTRPDPELLAPLETMGERRWRRRDPVWQRRRLDELRPVGAAPLEPIAAPPEVDESFDRGPAASGFEDLHDRDDQADADVSDQPESELEPCDTGTTEMPVSAADGALAAGRSELESVTPVATERPLEVPPESDIDPETLQAAFEEIDAELGRHSTDDGSVTTD